MSNLIERFVNLLRHIVTLVPNRRQLQYRHVKLVRRPLQSTYAIICPPVRGSVLAGMWVCPHSRMLTWAGLQLERAKCVCMVIVSDKIGGKRAICLT